MNTERQRLRHAFRLIRDTDENIHLKDRLISVSTQKTDYSKKSFVKTLSVMNAMLNRRFLTRNYKTRPDRIMFYSFFEKSPEKKLLHTHMILRVPKFIMRNYEKLKEFFRYFRNIVINKFFMTYTNYKRPEIATNYMTKHYRENNDNFFVF
jgi:hypothetical protein